MAEEGFFEGTKKGVVMMKVTKEEKELFEIVRKIKPEQWKALHGFMGEAKDIMQSGGLTSFFKSELMTIKDDLISMVLDPILAPILEALAPVIAEILEDVIPVIQDLLPIIQGLAEGLAEAIEVLKSVSIQLPGGDEWDVFWSGTLETLEKLMALIQEIFGEALSAEERATLEVWIADLYEKWTGGDPGLGRYAGSEHEFY